MQNEKYCNMKLRKRLFSDENIFLALYSVESYISNKELLEASDKIELERLKDKFNSKNINAWIKKIKKRLVELIDEDKFLEVNVYFKPKKYDVESNKVEFRPLHSAKLIEQITSVALLNILIYDFDATDKFIMSNLGRLIPHNFYGNRISYRPETLFKSWQSQYKIYSSQANELFEKYHETLEYKFEVNLDLINFFPSINNISLYNYIAGKFPVNLDEEDFQISRKILEKLLFVKVSGLGKNDLERYYNVPDGNLVDRRNMFTLGIPQGMPQAYFLANLCMIEIAKIYDHEFPGLKLFYVDDSVIFTNDISHFQDQINSINSKINEWLAVLYGLKIIEFDPLIVSFIEKNILNFKIQVHEAGAKSTFSNISDSKEGERYLKSISREVSKTAFDLNTSYSDEESAMLLNKTTKILEAIDGEIRIVKGEINAIEKMLKVLESENNADKTTFNSIKIEIAKNKLMSKDAYHKKLIRYMKYFKYRKNVLSYRNETDINILKSELIKDLSFLNTANKEEGIKEFFEKYTEDTLGAAINYVLKGMSDLKQNNEEIIRFLEKLNIMLFGENNIDTSYIFKAYEQYIKSNKTDERIDVDQYASLKIIVKEKVFSTYKKTDNIIEEIVKAEIEKIIKEKQYPLNKLLDQQTVKMCRVICANSEEIVRMMINSIISFCYQIEISDSNLPVKMNNRKLTYSELRMIVYLRSRKFEYKYFCAKTDSYLSTVYKTGIDYSIIQVLSIFSTFVREPERIDNLILVHKYTCDIWKNGSKHLYFYTLHNQEHAVDLIQNSIKVLRAVDYFQISENDYYILFMACYLHDISMVTLPELDKIQAETFETNKIYSQFINDFEQIKEYAFKGSNEVKKLLKEYYCKLDAFYESLVRDNHAKDSSKEIRNRNELNFIDNSLREIVAEVSQAHGYDVNEIYKVKSEANSSLISQKFTKIILRLSDLLDMSSYRVSQVLLDHNLDNMCETSKFHWLSHLLIDGYEIETNYELNNDSKSQNSYLMKKSITEILIITVNVRLSQFTKETPLKGCNGMKLSEFQKNELLIECGENCKPDKCNFLCKWFVTKNDYLFTELGALHEYLNSIPDNYFKSKIKVRVETTDKTTLTEKQFSMLKDYMDKQY